ncbi:hypothetical protein GCM10027447_06740 [Glycomyces halotolerans]
MQELVEAIAKRTDPGGFIGPSLVCNPCGFTEGDHVGDVLGPGAQSAFSPAAVDQRLECDARSDVEGAASRATIGRALERLDSHAFKEEPE